ncbi:MAG: hypothetical protein P5692_12620, partial [Limnospira sp. PMC 1280.21]|nr:hypothetical protein [Limnospira sp. PMC 1280.21]
LPQLPTFCLRKTLPTSDFTKPRPFQVKLKTPMWVGYILPTSPTSDFLFEENSPNFRLHQTATFSSQAENSYVGR